LDKNSWLYQQPMVLLLTIVLVAVVIRGLATGKATLVYTSYKKSEDPGYYWVGIAIPSILIVFGVYGLLFE
jgi:hypothetical protein